MSDAAGVITPLEKAEDLAALTGQAVMYNKEIHNVDELGEGAVVTGGDTPPGPLLIPIQ